MPLTELITRRIVAAGVGLSMTALVLGGDAANAQRSSVSAIFLTTFDQLRPSQGAIGMQDVTFKIGVLRDLADTPKKLAKYRLKEPLLVVRAPGDLMHIVDHHHLGRALWERGFRDVHVMVIGDLSTVALAAFWPEMEKRGWLRARDEEGRPIAPENLPLHVNDLKNDPYRSLAWTLRNAGGFDKTRVPFAEFMWGDYLRTKIDKTLIDSNIDEAVRLAMPFVTLPEAANLPGFKG